MFTRLPGIFDGKNYCVGCLSISSRTHKAVDNHKFCGGGRAGTQNKRIKLRLQVFFAINTIYFRRVLKVMAVIFEGRRPLWIRMKMSWNRCQKKISRNS